MFETDAMIRPEDQNDEKEEMLDRIRKQLTVITPEERDVLNKISKILDEHSIRYRNDPKSPRLFTATYEGKVDLNIIYSSKTVEFYITLPTLIQVNSIALTGIGLAEEPKDPFARVDLEAESGEVCVSYRYCVDNVQDLKESSFMVYLSHVVGYALMLYPRVSKLAVGKVSGFHMQKFYMELFKRSMDNLHDLDDGEVQYGTESLKLAIEFEYAVHKPAGSGEEADDEENADDIDDEDEDDEDEDIFKASPLRDVDRPTLPPLSRTARTIYEAERAFAARRKKQECQNQGSMMLFEGEDAGTEEESRGEDNEVS